MAHHVEIGRRRPFLVGQRIRIEGAADAGAAKIVGSPYGLVDALKKIDRAAKQIPMNANPATAHMFIIKPFSASGLLAMFSTHPPTEARIQALLQPR